MLGFHQAPTTGTRPPLRSAHAQSSLLYPSGSLPHPRILLPNLSSSTLSTSDSFLRVFHRLESRLAMYTANVSHIVIYYGARQTLYIIKVRAFSPSNAKNNQRHRLPSPAPARACVPASYPAGYTARDVAGAILFSTLPLPYA
ncbi:hypothetical protein B0H13DRAFT_2366853 [Mycena leptocephala]|nr:hypothetical protein B0H13DRAFT_2366853 [Mycena leptocephala]